MRQPVFDRLHLLAHEAANLLAQHDQLLRQLKTVVITFFVERHGHWLILPLVANERASAAVKTLARERRMQVHVERFFDGEADAKDVPIRASGADDG